MEGVLTWKRLLLVVLICMVIAQSLFIYSSSASNPNSSWAIPRPHRAGHNSNHNHESSDILTEAQCAHDFSDIHHEIDKSANYWKSTQHSITEKDANVTSWRSDAAIKVLIHENELRILETKGTFGNKGYRLRTLSFLSLLQRALWSATAGGERLPTIEAPIVVDDESRIPGGDDTHTVWTWTSQDSDVDQRHWLIPDFGFSYSSNTGSWSEARRRAAENDAPFVDKVPQAVWRGVTWTNPRIRDGLVNVTANKTWADVKITDWKTGVNLMPMEWMCRFAFTIHTEGRSYSGRLAYLLNCDSLPITHDLKWTAHFYFLLVPSGPHQNYVKVNSDWSDLEEKVQWYLAHPDDAQKVIDNSKATFRDRYTTSAATSCYLRKLVREYASVAIEPQVWRPHVEGQVKKRRGISFEEWVHFEGDYSERDET